MNDNEKGRADMRKKGLLFGMAALMAVSMTACGGFESAEPSTAADRQTDAASEESTSSDAAEADTSRESADDGDDGEENTVYRQQAEAIFAKAEQMLTALKGGGY